MTLELMAIIAATITLGGLILAQSRAAARERAEIQKRVDQLEVSLVDRIARLEGSVDVLREYFAGTGRDAA